VAGSRPIAAGSAANAKTLWPIDLSVSRAAIASSGLNQKMRLLLLCARIGYSPPASSQR
jgi:hypothetical protein